MTPFSGQGVRAEQRGLVIVHGFVALFLEVITLAIILLLIEFVALKVLTITTRMIRALIVLMTIVGCRLLQLRQLL
jgi:hypothetical protein